MNGSFESYLRSIRGLPLLTPAEELHLGTLVQTWRTAEEPPAPVIRRGRRALARMVSGNLRLVVSISLRQRHRGIALGVDTMDLVQAGNIGLIQAVERFDPTRGYRFSTYGYWWISQGIQRYLQEQAPMIRLPGQIQELAEKARSLQLQSTQPLSSEALSDALGESAHRINRALQLRHRLQVVPLDQPHPGGEITSSRLECISDGSVPSPEEDYNWLHRQLASLTPKQRQIIELRYLDENPTSISETARRIGLSNYHVEKQERQALHKLRHQLTPQ
jgi:RNA polymerase sigma factor (sigma-70 family)